MCRYAVVYLAGIPITPVPVMDDPNSNNGNGGGEGGVAAGERLHASGDAGRDHLVGLGHFSPRYCCASKHGSTDDSQCGVRGHQSATPRE